MRNRIVITLEELFAKMAYEFLLYVLASSSSLEREQALVVVITYDTPHTFTYKS